MTPAELLSAARRLVDEHERSTEALWGRAAALLARQALEQAMRDALVGASPYIDEAPFSVQLLVLHEALPNRDLAARAAYTWAALSRATHYQGYELPPTAEALRGWMGVVGEMVEG